MLRHPLSGERGLSENLKEAVPRVESSVANLLRLNVAPSIRDRTTLTEEDEVLEDCRKDDNIHGQQNNLLCLFNFTGYLQLPIQ
jgi:hypothetical protein